MTNFKTKEPTVGGLKHKWHMKEVNLENIHETGNLNLLKDGLAFLFTRSCKDNENGKYS